MSHKHTEIEPAEGITLFAGSSFSGKSAIMDAIKWVSDNKPVGDGYISYWARNEKGKQVEETYVTLELDDHIITRYRSATENKYVLDGQELFNVGKGAPPDIVLEALRFSEVNAQDQMEPLFLLNCSGGEVARILNKTVKLDLIDVMLSKAASFKKSNKKEVDVALANVENAKDKLKEYEFISKAEGILAEIEELENSMIDTSILEKEVDEYERAEAILEQCSIISTAEKLVKKINTLLSKEWDIIDLSKYEEAEDILVQCAVVPQAERLVKRITKYQGMLKDYDTSTLEKEVESYISSSDLLSTLPTKLKALQDELPPTCPACGKPLEDCNE